MRTITLLSGGVGGARMARGLAAILPGERLTVVTNVGDDDTIYGLDLCPDLDTVLYTLSGRESPHGWGLKGDTSIVMAHLERLGVDTSFRLGDADLATNLLRTTARRAGVPLSEVTARLSTALEVSARVLPATDERLRTVVETPAGDRLAFQEYFVLRGQRDRVAAVHFDGAEAAAPAPGVLDAIADAEILVIAPSNPVLSIWPILAVPGIREAVAAARRVVAVSPLFAGKALKGPAAAVMASLGLPEGTAGVLEAYQGLLHDLVVDIGDAGDVDRHAGDVRLHAKDTRLIDARMAARFAQWLLDLP